MKKIEEMDFVEGEVLLFNKPKSWTSFDVVKKIRSVLRVKKVGHAGTLDPLASGLLILCTGRKTKTITQIQDAEKEYEVEFRLGAVTQSYDEEHEPEDFKDTSHLTQEMVEAAMKEFTGEIKQYPPKFSAVKIDGKRAFKYAREGKEVEVRPRLVQIREFRLEEFRAPDWGRATVICTKGTYIRSLIHDLGQQLGVGAYITELKRTRIGEHALDNAFEINDFAGRIIEIRKSAREAGQ